MKTAHLMVLGSSLVCALAVSGTAGAGEVGYSGNACIPILPDAAKIDRSAQFAVANIGASGTALVECPFQLPNASAKVSDAHMTIYNRNPNVFYSCTLFGLRADGSVLWSDSVGTSITSAQAQSFAFFTHPDIFTLQMVLSCAIPPTFNGSFSHLASYRATTL
jgi:hypothetical protein